ncbi:MAG: helicase [Rhizobiales bacterium]|nr:helicase [Hyphomicrobiales bacterium]
MTINQSATAIRDTRARGVGVTAVLGPTNTGKTHLAIERMLAHSSGIIGLPLRLLAREVYNKITDRMGAEEVALITGEEKIKPVNPRFWVSTVEAMPRDLDVAFVAIDEIQLGADLERGHVFTDRMLNRRGREETLVLGAATMRPMVEKLLPGANIVSRPRLSQLTFGGDRKITRLPRRTAIVAFSADEVYAIAELIRRQRGGAAVVLGALSPRTRNAQVALYQSRDVDYLIATDAIGMGLNLDVDQVAFASDRKFDGYQYRRLNPAELAQIAGRAGRAMRDGTFATTGRCPPFEPELIEALESHRFESVKALQWRNATLDFTSLGALQASLAAAPMEQGLTRAPIAEDIHVLEHAARDDDVRAMATKPAAIERLWEVCQVPDYRKVAPANHAELAVTLYGFLMREGKIPADWFARQVDQADRIDGDIDTLSTRIAHVRTWTFVANRPDWLADPEHWQEVTRAVEDRLSDALHERLTARFVDRRTSVLMRRLRENDMLESEIQKSGEVVVEGHAIGRLEGFRFTADASAGGSEAKALIAAAQKALAGEIDARAARFAQSADDQFALMPDGIIRWTGDAVGKLIAGEDVLHPRVRILADEQLTGASREAVQARLDQWIKAHVEKLLGPLIAVASAEDVTGISRGVAFQLVEALGVLERQKVAEDVKGLDQPSRATLRKYGVRFGAYHIYVPALLKPAPRGLATQLFALKHEGSELAGLAEVQQLAAGGRTSIPVGNGIDRTLYRPAGYRVCGERAVRVDILERLADLIRPALAWREGSSGEKPSGAVDGRGFTVTVAMTSLAGSSGEDFASILRSLGYRLERRPKPVERPLVIEQPVTTEQSAVPMPTDGSAVEAKTTNAGDVTVAVAAPSVDNVDPDSISMPDGIGKISADTPVPALTETPAPTPASDNAAISDVTLHEGAFIEVWRPGRPPSEKRPDHRGSRRDRHRAERERPRAGTVAAPDSVAAAPLAQGDTPPAVVPDQEQPGHRRHYRPHRGKRHDRHDRHSRPEWSTQERREGQIRQGSGKSRDERRERAPDPNSPFAKLAALKAQLEADAKERR